MDITHIGEEAFMNQWRFELLAASERADENVAETAAWLGISKSAYYRRRRGEMLFSAYEVIALSQRFGLAVVPQDAPQFDFAVPLAADATFDEARYLHQLESAAAAFPDAAAVDVLVSATDIPIFYLFAEPDLAALKRYLFGLAIDASEARRFSLPVARREHAEFVHRAATLSKTYVKTRREEAWGPSPLRSLLYQVLLLVESAAITRNDCEAVLAAIERVIDRIGAQLTSSESDNSRLKLWQNRLHATSSIICMRAGEAGRLFVTFDNPNFFHSATPEAVRYFESHFDALRKRSLRVAGHGALSPARYVEELRAEVTRGRERAMRVFEDVGRDF